MSRQEMWKKDEEVFPNPRNLCVDSPMTRRRTNEKPHHWQQLYLNTVYNKNRSFYRFTWFNMGRITKNDGCLIKTIKTENITHKRNMT